MLALIMAGGYGKRLGPLTDKIPKPLIMVGNKPIIYWQIKWLERCGADRFVLLGGYRADKLVKYIKSIGYWDRFQFSIEKKPLGSAGAIRNAHRFLEGDRSFLVVNGDNVTNLDARRLKLQKGRLACLALIPYRSSKGLVKFRGDVVTSLEEKPIMEGYWFNGGVLMLSKDILRMLPKEGSLESEVFPKLSKNRKLSCVRFGGSYFNSVDSLKDLEDINRDMLLGRIKF